MLKFGVIPCKTTRSVMNLNQGIRIKGRDLALVWHEKASRNALQTSSLYAHSFGYTHNSTTVKEIAEYAFSYN